MKTNEVQKVSEHFLKSFISFSHLETTRIEGGRALHFFPQDPLEIFCYFEFALKSPQSLFPDVFPHAFWNRPPGVFPSAFPMVSAMAQVNAGGESHLVDRTEL